MNVHDIAFAFVAGALSPVERAEVTVRRRYDGRLNRAITDAELQLAGLDAASVRSDDEAPPRQLWEHITGTIDAQRDAFSNATVEEFDEGEWTPHTDSIDVKMLWSDNSMLLRCGPGAIEDAHDQDPCMDEHLLVIAGDVTMGGRHFAPGDWIRVAAGTRHRRMTTKGGCILLSHSVDAEPR